MKQYSLLLFVCTLFFFNSYAVDTTAINYNDFTDLSAWKLNGTARGAISANKSVLRLTANTTSQSGSAFINNPIQMVSDKGFLASFSAYFSFQISNCGGLDEGDGAGADGLVFVIQTVANNVGSLGGGLGYRGLQRSIGIEFDTWNNSDLSHDPDHNHVGIDTNGNTQSIITCSEKKALFNNGKIWYVWIDYDGDNQLLEVRYNSLNVRPDTAQLPQKINIPVLLEKENAYVGFSSATGLSYNTHDILSLNFVNKFQPYTYSLSLSANPDTTVNVSDSVFLLATIRDMSNNVQPDSSKKTEWRIIDAGGNPSSILNATSGSSVVVVPQTDNSQIKIEGKALVNGQTLTDTITIHVMKMVDTFSLEIVCTPDTVVKSHGKVTLQSRVYDNSHTLLRDSAQKTTWKIVSADINPESILQSTTGAEVDLVPIVPYTYVFIEASVIINKQKLVDTIKVRVTAGDPYRIVIEKGPIAMQLANPLEMLTLTKYPDNDSVYAVVRDKWGGYCRMADSLTTNWLVVAGSAIVTVAGADHRRWVGQIKRSGPSGEALIEASEGSLIKDSLPVLVENLYIEKIVIRDKESGKTLDSVIATIKQLRSLEVYGLVAGSDPQLEKSWIRVKADWSLSGSLTSVENPLPQGSETWDLIANSAGQGTLTVKNGTHENRIAVTIIQETAPYLTRAVYFPSSGSSKGVIKLYFSEDVDLGMLGKLLPESTLLYSSFVRKSTEQILGGASYVDISADQFGKVITVQVGSGADNIIPNLDSLSIIDGTVNRHNVAPDKQNAKKVSVEIQGGEISVAISSNPFNIQEPVANMPSKVVTFYNNLLKNNSGNGVIIAVHSSIPLKPKGDSFGTAIIYDPLGNIVCKGLQLKEANSNTKVDYGIYWNGLNHNGRIVGRGSYLVKINASDMDGKAHLLSIKLGVIDNRNGN